MRMQQQAFFEHILATLARKRLFISWGHLKTKLPFMVSQNECKDSQNPTGRGA